MESAILHHVGVTGKFWVPYRLLVLDVAHPVEVLTDYILKLYVRFYSYIG